MADRRRLGSFGLDVALALLLKINFLGCIASSLSDIKMKKLKSRAYKDRLKGHKDTIIYLHSPQGPEGGLLYSGSADFAFRAWDLVKR